MKLFIYEHITGGGLAGAPLPSSLADEGGAMLRALLEDLLRVPGISVATTVDERVANSVVSRFEGCTGLLVGRTRSESREHFDRLASSADACLIIAPETDGALLERTGRARELGAAVFGSAAAAIRLATDKLELSRHLAERGVPCVPAVAYRPGRTAPFPPPWVLKPRDGAGSMETYLISDPSARVDSRNAILTPFVPGLAASVLAIAGDRDVLLLAPCGQTLSADGRFRYLGGTVPLSPELRSRASALARRAIDAVPGLSGFVGVDLILGDGRDPGAVDTVVEINPRLTTSYVGLRALARANLAERWLEMMRGRPARRLDWRDREARFTASGEVREEARA